MFDRDRESRAGFATGMLAGALVGASVALLLAPKAGSALRGEIGVNRRYRELAERAGVTVENLQDRVMRATDAFEAGAREMLRSAESASRQARTDPVPSIRNDMPRV
jgi:gas vesicle protein